MKFEDDKLKLELEKDLPIFRNCGFKIEWRCKFHYLDGITATGLGITIGLYNRTDNLEAWINVNILQERIQINSLKDWEKVFDLMKMINNINLSLMLMY